MAKVIRVVWKSGPRKIKRTAFGYTLQINGKQERRYDAAWAVCPRTKQAYSGAAVNRPVSILGTLLASLMTSGGPPDAAGHPLPLPYDARRGPSFVALARKTTVDLHPRALLDVLISAGTPVRRSKASRMR